MKPRIYPSRTKRGKRYNVLAPKYLSFSNIPVLNRLNDYFFKRSVQKAYRRIKINIDFIYAHFLFGPGRAAKRLFFKFGTPFYIALGESRFRQEFYKKKSDIQETFDVANGIISVSNEIKNRIFNAGYRLKTNKLLIAPNGVDFKKFYPMNQREARKNLGINYEDFIVIFVGAFSHRKGIERLDKALIEMNENIKAIFIGQGAYKPTYDNIIYSGPLEHNMLSYYLNASDVFVLPTVNEGSSNAIIEAIACGLPVISANETFNADILEDSYSLKVNPLNIEDIKDAIGKLYNNHELAENMAKKAEEFSLLSCK